MLNGLGVGGALLQENRSGEPKYKMNYRILIVDDELDVHKVTRMSLKNLTFHDQPVEFISLTTGSEAVQYLQEHTDIAVILMDVVMEEEQSGLAAIHQIRHQLDNQMVRILVHTGQPGIAPERQVILDYDIDDYLAKSEMTSNRLFVSVRTALKSFHELTELQKHRDILDLLHRSVLNLHTRRSTVLCLNHLMDIAATVLPSKLTWLFLDPAGVNNHPHLYYRGDGSQTIEMLAKSAADLFLAVKSKEDNLAILSPCWFEEGFISCLDLPQQQGRGFLYVQRKDDPRLMAQILSIMVSHAATALQMQSKI